MERYKGVFYFYKVESHVDKSKIGLIKLNLLKDRLINMGYYPNDIEDSRSKFMQIDVLEQERCLTGFYVKHYRELVKTAEDARGEYVTNSEWYLFIYIPEKELLILQHKMGYGSKPSMGSVSGEFTQVFGRNLIELFENLHSFEVEKSPIILEREEFLKIFFTKGSRIKKIELEDLNAANLLELKKSKLYTYFNPVHNEEDAIIKTEEESINNIKKLKCEATDEGTLSKVPGVRIVTGSAEKIKLMEFYENDILKFYYDKVDKIELEIDDVQTLIYDKDAFYRNIKEILAEVSRIYNIHDFNVVLEDNTKNLFDYDYDEDGGLFKNSKITYNTFEALYEKHNLEKYNLILVKFSRSTFVLQIPEASKKRIIISNGPKGFSEKEEEQISVLCGGCVDINTEVKFKDFLVKEIQLRYVSLIFLLILSLILYGFSTNDSLYNLSKDILGLYINIIGVYIAIIAIILPSVENFINFNISDFKAGKISRYFKTDNEILYLAFYSILFFILSYIIVLAFWNILINKSIYIGTLKITNFSYICIFLVAFSSYLIYLNYMNLISYYVKMHQDYKLGGFLDKYLESNFEEGKK